MELYDTRLEFSIHETTKQILIKVVDTVNNEVIREILRKKSGYGGQNDGDGCILWYERA